MRPSTTVWKCCSIDVTIVSSNAANLEDVDRVIFSPNRSQVASLGGAEIRLWDLASGRLLRALAHEAYLTTAEISADEPNAESRIRHHFIFAAVQRLDPIFKTLAPGRGDIPRTPGRDKLAGTAEDGYIHCGPSGSGHFVKMVHNGIEYGMMQAYAEGFDIFKNATSKELPEDIRYDLNLPDIAEVWRRGSVVSSWLLDLTAMALTENPTLSEYSGFVQDSGEGRWTIQAALEEAVPAEVLTAALYTRFRSRQDHTFAEKMLSAMRQKFGGHVEPKKH